MSSNTFKPNMSPDHSSDTPSLAHQTQGSQDLHKVFSKFDLDNDGKISLPELESILRSLGTPDPSSEAASMMRTADADGDGFIDYEEFKSVIRTGMDDHKCVEDLKEAFAVYDKNGDGVISAGELRSVLKRVMGDAVSLEECEGMLRAFDANDDGAVNFEEFVKMMTKSIS